MAEGAAIGLADTTFRTLQTMQLTTMKAQRRDTEQLFVIRLDWYSGSGSLDVNGTATTNLLRSEGGPCIGCPYQVPTTTDVGIPITLGFSSPGEGRVSWQGEIVPIQRLNFKLGDGLEKLLGEWILITAKENSNTGRPLPDPANGDYYGDRKTLNKIMADGSALGSGVLLPNKVVGGMTDSPSQFKYYLMRESGYYNNVVNNVVFAFNFKGLNKIEGVRTFLAGESPTLADINYAINNSVGTGERFEGYRTN